MSLETATYISGLVQTNPVGSDPLSDADGHLRLIKSTLKATFPNITGAVTVTQDQLNNPFPIGGIIMWNGTTVPSGWALCNGQTVTRTDGGGNITTPNLKDRFIISSGDSHVVGSTGGASSVTLSISNLPAHTHTISGTVGAAGGHTHSINDPGHTHSTNSRTAQGPGGQWGGGGEATTYYDSIGSSVTGISINGVGDHTHSFSGSASSVGSGSAFSILPPYYCLAFIMKV